MGDRFENQEADALTRIVRDYPLSDHVDAAKDRLTAMKRPVPQADPAAYARMKYELENRDAARAWCIARLGPFVSHPETSLGGEERCAGHDSPCVRRCRSACRLAAAGGQSGVSDVSASQVVDEHRRDRQEPGCAPRHSPRRRARRAAAPASRRPASERNAVQPADSGSTPAATAPAADQPLPTNHPPTKEQLKAYKKAAGEGGETGEERPPKLPDRGRRVLPAQRLPLRRRNAALRRRPAMSRILLADDSPHAQRMGERILRDEGHEVITVSDGLVAMLRLKDAQPDLIIADISMPEVSGYELCEYVKNNGGAPVFLTAGAVEPVDEAEVARVRADGVLKKPFEASLLLEAIGRFATVKTAQRSARPRREAATKPACPALRGRARSRTGARRRHRRARRRHAGSGRRDQREGACRAHRTSRNARAQSRRLSRLARLHDNYFLCQITASTSSPRSKCRR